MWTRSENSNVTIPPKMETSGNNVILRKNFRLIEETEDRAAHYEYDEWQMTKEQYEIYQYHETILNEQADALVELAELISEVS